VTAASAKSRPHSAYSVSFVGSGERLQIIKNRSNFTAVFEHQKSKLPIEMVYAFDERKK
jgi:hypothetical protein